jgi:hypothetical protein
MAPPGRVVGHDDYDNDEIDDATVADCGGKKAEARHLTINKRMMWWVKVIDDG